MKAIFLTEEAARRVDGTAIRSFRGTVYLLYSENFGGPFFVLISRNDGGALERIACMHDQVARITLLPTYGI